MLNVRNTAAVRPEAPQMICAQSAPVVAITFIATDVAARRALLTIRHALKYLALSETSMGLIEIVLAEVFNNIVEHAYQNTGCGVIGLSCRTTSHGVLYFEVSDTGSPLPGTRMPAKCNHDLTVEQADLPEGGFGWGLIRDLTSSLAYCRLSGRNLLRFSISGEQS